MLGGEPLGSERRTGEENDGLELATDGGTTVTDGGGKPDWVKVDDETWDRLQREAAIEPTVHVDVELPRESYDMIREKIDAYRVDFEEIAIEFLLHEYRFTVDSEKFTGPRATKAMSRHWLTRWDSHPCYGPIQPRSRDLRISEPTKI